MRGGAGRLVLLAILSLACASGCIRAPAPEGAAEARLRADLMGLPGPVDAHEAGRVARTALEVTARLRQRYRPLRPPQLGNLAFHLGLRERGLCCHWAGDLLTALEGLGLRSLEPHWGVAHLGSPLREHSAVVLVPEGARFGQGMVLDAWRHSGRLYWARADRDRFTWRQHPSDRARRRVVCASEAR